MRILVKVKPNSKQEKLKIISEREFQVWVREPAQDSRANKATLELISKYFQVSKSKVRILKGFSSPYKFIEIL